MEAAEIDKELSELETKAEHLRALYEQYFMGMERIEPMHMRRDVERRILVLRREQLRNTAQRFKFNTLVQRFNTMQQHWARIVREIENGTYKRDVIKAAARFGDSALTALGKKKTKNLMAAVAQAQDRIQGKRKVDDAFELAEDDLIEEVDEAEEDEAPTPPKLGAVVDPPPPNPSAGAPASGRQPYAAGPSSGLGHSDLPLVGLPQPAPALGPLPQPVPPPQRGAGARWAAPPSDPGSAVRPTGAAQPSRPQASGFGELDLDFDDSGRPAPAQPAPPAARPNRPLGWLPAVSSPPRSPAARPAPGAAAPPVAAKGPAPPTSGFGVLDIPLDEAFPAAAAPKPQPVVPAPSSPGSGIRPNRPEPARPIAAPAKPQPAPAAPAQASAPAGDLHDQRIRQIYAKYVETKRSTQESTAGVTYEKLAASLRAQANKLKEAHPNRSIDYEVVVKDGKTHLKPVLR